MSTKLIILIAAAVIPVEATPKCEAYNDGTNVVCSVGDTDYIIERGLVSDSNKTTSITLRACRITDVEYEAFENLFYLKSLDLSQNKIQRLKLGVLDEFHQLTFLNLSYNVLTTFPLGLFDQKPNLLTLDLKDNKINNLELGVFDPLKKLRYLDLSGNNILGRDLNPYIFDQNKHITHIDFSRNDMTDTPENMLSAFESLEELVLDRCFLPEIPSFAAKANLRTLKHLSLPLNKISRIDNPTILVNLINLKVLDLGYNNIEHVDENVFVPLRVLTKIILRNNKLVSISDRLFQNLPKLTALDLAYNELEFVPVNAFRGTSLKFLNLSNNKFTYLTDNFCLELRNSGVRLTKFYFNDNPWQCACLNDVLKEVKKYRIDYNNVKYNGEVPVCVTTTEFYCKRNKVFNDEYLEMFSLI